MNLYEKLIVGFKYYEYCSCGETIYFEYDCEDKFGNNFYKTVCDRCNNEYTLKPVIWGMNKNES